MILAGSSFLTGFLSLSWWSSARGLLPKIDWIRGFSLSFRAKETRTVAPRTAIALVIAVRTSTVFAMSFPFWGGIMYVPLMMETFGEERMAYKKATAPNIKTIRCLVFKVASFWTQPSEPFSLRNGWAIAEWDSGFLRSMQTKGQPRA